MVESTNQFASIFNFRVAALIGGIYVDKGIEYCRKVCEVTLFPRLEVFFIVQIHEALKLPIISLGLIELSKVVDLLIVM